MVYNINNVQVTTKIYIADKSNDVIGRTAVTVSVFGHTELKAECNGIT